MACALQKLDLCFRQGSTVRLPVRVETDELVWKPITGISLTAPVELTVLNHECPDEWLAAVTGVKQPRDLNTTLPLKASAFRPVKIIDASAVSFNGVDGSVLRPYTSGGHLVYYKPLDLDQYVAARMDVRNKVGGELLATFTTTDGSLELDNVNRVLWINRDAITMATKTYTKGVFDIELINGGGEVRAICSADSTITISPEITTSHP